MDRKEKWAFDRILARAGFEITSIKEKATNANHQ